MFGCGEYLTKCKEKSYVGTRFNICTVSGVSATELSSSGHEVGPTNGLFGPHDCIHPAV